MRAFIGQALKSLVLCGVVYLLLLGVSRTVELVNRSLTEEYRDYAFENLWYIKFPLFGLVIYLVFSKRL